VNILESLRAIIDARLRRLDYHALYSSTVLAQNADGTLELQPDDARFGTGVSKVPIRLGIPGASVRVRAPSRVLLGFDNGDPRLPIATLWDTSSLDTLNLTAGVALNINATGGAVTVTATGGTIAMICDTPSGITIGDGSGNEAPVARVGDTVAISGGGALVGGVIIEGATVPFAPGSMMTGPLLGYIQSGATITKAD